jgi:hypothetical protein
MVRLYASILILFLSAFPDLVRPSGWSPQPLVFQEAGGMLLALRNLDGDASHVHVDLCGHDVTRVPVGFPITFGFDVPVRHDGTSHEETDMGLRVRVSGPTLDLRLMRDPFTPPGPWRVSVQVALADAPRRVHIAVGTQQGHDIVSELVATGESGAIKNGHGCVDLLAAGAGGQSHDVAASSDDGRPNA